jgi:hypothetical protein
MCAEAIRRIAELYQLEKEIREKGLEGEAKQKVRGEKSRTLVAEFFEWLNKELIASVLLPKHPFTKAANYALKRNQALEVFLADPNVPMDTNHLRRGGDLRGNESPWDAFHGDQEHLATRPPGCASDS